MKTFIRYSFIGFFLLVCWQCLVMTFDIPFYLLPTPYQVFVTLFTQQQLLLPHLYTTVVETLLGFSLGILFGCITAFLLAYFRVIAIWFLPLLIISQAIPTFAIAPLIVVWLGYGMPSKVAVTILMIFFPVTSAFYDGLRQTQVGWLELAQTMQAKTWRVFWFIRIPAALPALASGIRIAAVTAPIGAIVGEWVGSSSGLGYFMLNANARLQIDQMFAALILIIGLALMLYWVCDKLIQKFIWWKI